MVLVGGIIMEISIALILIVYFLGQSSFGAKTSAEILVAANAGVQDAMLKVVRNINFSGSYALSVGGVDVDVQVVKDSPAVDKDKIISTASGKIFAKTRRLQAILNLAGGEVDIESIQEVSL